MNEFEWQTRMRRIDARLRSLNPPWQIIRFDDGLAPSKLTCHASPSFRLPPGRLYALCVNGVLLGIIEARKVTAAELDALLHALLGRVFRVDLQLETIKPLLCLPSVIPVIP